MAFFIRAHFDKDLLPSLLADKLHLLAPLSHVEPGHDDEATEALEAT
jgi:hypothetical protein